MFGVNTFRAAMIASVVGVFYFVYQSDPSSQFERRAAVQVQDYIKVPSSLDGCLVDPYASRYFSVNTDTAGRVVIGAYNSKYLNQWTYTLPATGCSWVQRDYDLETGVHMFANCADSFNYVRISADGQSKTELQWLKSTIGDGTSGYEVVAGTYNPVDKTVALLRRIRNPAIALTETQPNGTVTKTASDTHLFMTLGTSVQAVNFQGLTAPQLMIEEAGLGSNAQHLVQHFVYQTIPSTSTSQGATDYFALSFKALPRADVTQPLAYNAVLSGWCNTTSKLWETSIDWGFALPSVKSKRFLYANCLTKSVDYVDGSVGNGMFVYPVDAATGKLGTPYSAQQYFKVTCGATQTAKKYAVGYYNSNWDYIAIEPLEVTGAASGASSTGGNSNVVIAGRPVGTPAPVSNQKSAGVQMGMTQFGWGLSLLALFLA